MSSKKLGKSALLETVVAMLRQYDSSKSAGTARPGLSEDVTPLQLAALDGRLDVVKRLIEDKYPIDEVHKNLQRPIHFAIQNGHIEVVKYLAEKGSAINSTGGGPPPIGTAIAFNQLECVRYLLQKGAKIEFDTVDPDGTLERNLFDTFVEECEPNTLQYKVLKETYGHHLESGCKIGAVHVAVNYSYLDVLKCLLEFAPSTKLDDGPFSPFHIAVKVGNLEIIKYLTESGPTAVNVDTSDGTMTPLHVAILFGQLEIVAFLVETLKANAQVTCAVHNYTPLHMAAHTDQPDIIKCLVRNGAQLSVFDDEGYTPLHIAARRSLESVRCLVHGGAPVLTTNKNMATALHLAAAGKLNPDDPTKSTEDFVEIVEYLVEQGADVKAIDRFKFTPLHTAAFHGNLRSVKYLARVAHDVDAHTEGGQGSALHLAVLCDHLPVVEYLLEYGARTDIRGEDGNAPMHIAAACGHLECVKCLVQNGADINALQSDNLTPLVQAAAKAHTKVVAYLLEVGADPNTCDTDGTSPFLNVLRLKLRSESTKYDEIAELLIRHGADLSLANKLKLEPLTLAICLGNLGACQFLCDRGAQVNVDTPGRMSPLFVAIEQGHLNIVKFLIERGANVGCHTQEQGFTPLHFTADTSKPSVSNFEIMKYLVEEGGIPVDVKTDENVTPLHLACNRGNLHLVQYLVNAGASVNSELNNLQFTPLHGAIATGSLDVAEYLIQSGANPNAGSIVTPLAIAVAIAKELKAVKLFLSHGVEINKNDPENPNHIDSLLKNACIVGAFDIFKYLVKVHGADPHAKNVHGYNMIMWAARKNQWEIVEYLTDGVSFPLHQAAALGHKVAVQLVLASGEIPIDSQEAIGFTPLQLAAENGHAEIIKLLIEKGADVTAKNEHCSVLHCSIEPEEENVYCTAVILKALKVKFSDNTELLSAHIDMPDSDGDTPLMWAIHLEKIDTTRLLLAYGANTTELVNKKGENAMDRAKRAGNIEIRELLTGPSPKVADDKSPDTKSDGSMAANDNTPTRPLSVDSLSDNLAKVILDDAKVDFISKLEILKVPTVPEQSKTLMFENDMQNLNVMTENDPIPKFSENGVADIPIESTRKCKVCCSIV